jgi:UDP-3-O-[3-hydroxymyristoyl] glucosamine N-acyltransferase
VISFTTAELANTLGARLQGDGARILAGLKGLAEAGNQDLSFLARADYAELLQSSRAGAILIKAPDVHLAPEGSVCLIVEDPYLSFARALALFHPEERETRRGIHPSAVVDESARLAEDCWVGPCCVVEAGVSIGPGTVLEASCFVGKGVVIGANCQLRAGVQLRHGSKLGNRVLVQNGSIVGSEGFGFVPQGDKPPEKIPQVGGVLIEDDVEIGANCCIDRGTMEDTILRRGVKLDNLIQIAHNVEVGAGTVMAAQSGVAGSTKVGSACMIGGGVSITGHATIGDGVKLGGRSAVMGSIAQGRVYAGNPARPHREFLAQSAALKHLPEMVRQMRRLERQLKAQGLLPGEEEKAKKA